MKNLYLIFLILILIFCSGFSESVRMVAFKPNLDRLENIFKAYLPAGKDIIYTQVPRGLIISIDEKKFFNTGEARIKESSLCILDTIAIIIKELKNYCIIEDHTETQDFTNSYYNENWEISIARASNLAEYLVKYKNLPTNRIFPVGFSNIMPFKDNVAPINGMNNRIDFVIIDYEVKR